MKKTFKRWLSSILAVATVASTFATFSVVNADTLDYKNFVDADASLDSKFTKVENYDNEYGNVYKFETGTTYEGTDWFSEGFENGTYVVSMDFKVDQYPASGKQERIMINSEAWNDRVILDLKTTGILAYSISDADGFDSGYQYKYGTNYAENAWNNFSVVYEKKSDAEVVAKMYVNGVKIGADYTLSDNFRFRRISVVTGGGADFYLDNISCKKISADAFSIENVDSVFASKTSTSVSKLKVKLNQTIDKASVTSVSVKKAGTDTEAATAYKVVGEYIYVDVKGLHKNAGYTLTINNGAKSITGDDIAVNTYEKQASGQVVEYIHQDEDALLDTKYTKVENYDEDHGNVYKFSEVKEVTGTDWFTEGFENGTYVVSMDFKVNKYPASGTTMSIYTESEAWNDRVTLALRATGVIAYTIRDAEAERTGYQYKYGTNYAENAWNNYSIVYEKKSDAEVIATQYINGVKMQEGVTLTDNFRFRRITLHHATSEDFEFYLDNITCRSVSDEDLMIEDVNSILADGANSTLSKIRVKFNQVVNPATVSGVTVVKEGFENNLVTSCKAVGQYMDVYVKNLRKNDGYTLTLADATISITGNTASAKTYTKQAEGEAENYIHFDEDALMDSNWATENQGGVHGNVYKFAEQKEYKGSDWFTEGFENGTYVVSMDFKVNQYPASGTAISIMTDSEEWTDRVTLALRATGVLAYTIRDAEGERTGYQYKYGTNYKADEWNNYSIVYEKKSETEVVATPYVNGVKVCDGVTQYDNFRFKRITILPNTAEGTELYLDNIMCYEISGKCDVAINGLYAGTEKITEPSEIAAASVIKANVDYKNESANDKSVTYIIGFYDVKGRLVGVDIADVITVSGMASGSQDVEFETLEDMSKVSEVKVFAWDNLVNISSLGNVYSISNK